MAHPDPQARRYIIMAPDQSYISIGWISVCRTNRITRRLIVLM
jgi:hypothetical protein